MCTSKAGCFTGILMHFFQTIVSATTLRQNLDNSNWRVVDCRFDLMQPTAGMDKYRAGHIPGAVYANLDLDLAGPITSTSGRHPLPDPDIFAAKLGEWGIDSSCQVVAYDDAGGAIAARLWWMLRWLGHSRVAVLDGGMSEWLSAGYDLDDGLPDRQFRAFVREPLAMPVISTEALESALAAPDRPLLLDARAPERFNGQIEPIDNKAGHIPGAVNLPFGRCLGTKGTWRPADEIAAIFGDIGVDLGTSSAIAMCGSGVTACHLVLSALVAGLPEPGLYVGSWSEWIRGASRPVATIDLDGDQGE